MNLKLMMPCSSHSIRLTKNSILSILRDVSQNSLGSHKHVRLSGSLKNGWMDLTSFQSMVIITSVPLPKPSQSLEGRWLHSFCARLAWGSVLWVGVSILEVFLLWSSQNCVSFPSVCINTIEAFFSDMIRTRDKCLVH